MSLNVSPEVLGQVFSLFAIEAEKEASTLYKRLALAIAADPEMLEIAARAGTQPIPNVFLAAVQFLLYQDPGAALRAYYPNMTDGSVADGDPYPAFREFVFAGQNLLERMIAVRLTQTNEVRRCACLLPAFGLAAGRAGKDPLALVEIGTSAGLNLMWDCYGFDYGEAGRFGDPHSPVQLACEWRSQLAIPVPKHMPAIAYRCGIDLNPIDVFDPDELLWLRSLIWPEHTDRQVLLDRAMDVMDRAEEAGEQAPDLLAGHALDALPEVFAEIPLGTSIVVFHSFVLNQWSNKDAKALDSMLQTEAHGRLVHRISMEFEGDEHPVLRLTTYERSAKTDLSLAHCNPHGRWIEWL